MSHFAQIDENGIVQRVVVADQAFIDTGKLGDPATFVQTSYNKTIRKNFAGIGYTYHKDKDMFTPPKPHASWILDEEKGNWKAPKDMPTIPQQAPFTWEWDEVKQDWIKVQDI